MDAIATSTFSKTSCPFRGVEIFVNRAAHITTADPGPRQAADDIV